MAEAMRVPASQQGMGQAPDACGGSHNGTCPHRWRERDTTQLDATETGSGRRIGRFWLLVSPHKSVDAIRGPGAHIAAFPEVRNE